MDLAGDDVVMSIAVMDAAPEELGEGVVAIDGEFSGDVVDGPVDGVEPSANGSSGEVAS